MVFTSKRIVFFFLFVIFFITMRFPINWMPDAAYFINAFCRLLSVIIKCTDLLFAIFRLEIM